jgi:hypothetical protein
MDSDHVIELLHAAYEELHRLEPLLKQNPVYRRVKALRIDEYQADIAGSRRPDLRSCPESAWSTSALASLRDPIAPATVSPAHAPSAPRPQPHPATDPDLPANTRARAPASPALSRQPRGGPREKSQAAHIRDAAYSYLREKGTPSRGTEIYNAIRAKGVEVRGKKPSAVVANALRWSPGSFELTPEGFRLTEWSNNRIS